MIQLIKKAIILPSFGIAFSCIGMEVESTNDKNIPQVEKLNDCYNNTQKNYYIKRIFFLDEMIKNTGIMIPNEIKQLIIKTVYYGPIFMSLPNLTGVLLNTAEKGKFLDIYNKEGFRFQYFVSSFTNSTECSTAKKGVVMHPKTDLHNKHTMALIASYTNDWVPCITGIGSIFVQNFKEYVIDEKYRDGNSPFYTMHLPQYSPFYSAESIEDIKIICYR